MPQIEPKPCTSCLGSGEVLDPRGRPYECPACRGSGEATFLLLTEPEETCPMCATHRRLSAQIERPDETWPGGVPRCTFHIIRMVARAEVIALRRELSR